MEFYDRKEELLKTLVFDGYRQYLDQYWRAASMHMENHQTGKKTTLEFKEYQFRIGLDEGDFTKSRLKRVR